MSISKTKSSNLFNSDIDHLLNYLRTHDFYEFFQIFKDLYTEKKKGTNFKEYFRRGEVLAGEIFCSSLRGDLIMLKILGVIEDDKTNPSIYRVNREKLETFFK